jgi:hypothetical protein
MQLAILALAAYPQVSRLWYDMEHGNLEAEGIIISNGMPASLETCSATEAECQSRKGELLEAGEMHLS